MKRLIVICLTSLLISSPAFCQLLVESNGNVGVKYDDVSTIVSNFTVNSPGDSEITTYILSDDESQNAGMRLTKLETQGASGDYNMGIRSSVRNGLNDSKKAYGFYTHVYKNSLTECSNGRSYGIYAVAGNSTSGWNYGVFGTLCGTNNGAGVFGSSESLDGGVNTQGKFAGFFHGKVKVTNSVEASAFNVSSDYRLKENIEPVKTGNIDDIMKLNVVKYNLKQRIVDVGDTATIPVSYYTEDSNLLQKTHYGLIAQELQEIYPDLVYEGGDGYLSVNYMEIIPLLIKSVQELKLQLNDLTNAPEKAELRTGETTNVTDILSSVLLYQNNPNPFTESTIIKCFVPEEIKRVDLYIYDMNGRQIDGRNVTDRGNVSIAIEGGSLDAGIYLYSLIADGVIIDTKRMILTK